MEKTDGPETVLNQAMKGIKKSGIDGLKPYLNDNGAKKVNMAKKVAKGAGIFGGLIPQRSTGGVSPKAAAFLLNNMSKFDWALKQVKKIKTGAKGTLSFKYKDKVDGTIVLYLVEDSGKWKINDIDMPTFNKMEL